MNRTVLKRETYVPWILMELFSARDKFVGELDVKIYGGSSASGNDRVAPIPPFLQQTIIISGG